MEMKVVDVEKPDDVNFILGQTHFIKSIEDLYEAMVNSNPKARFGIAFCEASGARKVRVEGNDEEMMELARKNALKIGAGHSFIIFMKECYPINVLNAIKNVPEVCRIFCATANPTRVVVLEDENRGEKGRAILGVIDGFVPVGIEDENDIKWRKEFLRKIGYKL
ncbi:MAG: hypothetical protein DRN13_00685 [Thermoplasmata archaeon]|nr:MAG: hypothetical protein DRN13_00685 [Thermoplasmata archaeon]